MKCLSMWRRMELLEEEINKNLGSYNLSNTAQDIYIYIGAYHHACITTIIDSNYFKNKSFSTIKRAVLELKSNELIHSLQSEEDKRIVWLTLNTEE